jgi:hypothetical protein
MRLATVNNTVPEVTDVSVSPSPARNSHEVTISATVSEASTVLADVSDLDTMQTEIDGSHEVTVMARILLW